MPPTSFTGSTPRGVNVTEFRLIKLSIPKQNYIPASHKANELQWEHYANTPQESLILRLETHRTPIALIPTVTPTPLPPAFDPTNPHTFSTPRFAVEDESQPIGLGSHRRNAPGYKGVGIGGGGTGAVRIQAEGNGRERCLMRALIGEKEYVSLELTQYLPHWKNPRAAPRPINVTCKENAILIRYISPIAQLWSDKPAAEITSSRFQLRFSSPSDAQKCMQEICYFLPDLDGGKARNKVLERGMEVGNSAGASSAAGRGMGGMMGIGRRQSVFGRDESQTQSQSWMPSQDQAVGDVSQCDAATSLRGFGGESVSSWNMARAKGLEKRQRFESAVGLEMQASVSRERESGSGMGVGMGGSVMDDRYMKPNSIDTDGYVKPRLPNIKRPPQDRHNTYKHPKTHECEAASSSRMALDRPMLSRSQAEDRMDIDEPTSSWKDQLNLPDIGNDSFSASFSQNNQLGSGSERMQSGSRMPDAVPETRMDVDEPAYKKRREDQSQSLVNKTNLPTGNLPSAAHQQPTNPGYNAGWRTEMPAASSRTSHQSLHHILAPDSTKPDRQQASSWSVQMQAETQADESMTQPETADLLRWPHLADLYKATTASERDTRNGVQEAAPILRSELDVRTPVRSSNSGRSSQTPSSTSKSSGGSKRKRLEADQAPVYNLALPSKILHDALFAELSQMSMLYDLDQEQLQVYVEEILREPRLPELMDRIEACLPKNK